MTLSSSESPSKQNQKILVLESATIHRVKTMADKTLSIELRLREMGSDDMAVIMAAYMEGKEGVAFQQSDPSKSPSKRLRDVIFRYYELKDWRMSFEAFYESQIEKIINKYKSILNEKTDTQDYAQQ